MSITVMSAIDFMGAEVITVPAFMVGMVIAAMVDMDSVDTVVITAVLSEAGSMAMVPFIALTHTMVMDSLIVIEVPTTVRTLFTISGIPAITMQPILHNTV